MSWKAVVVADSVVMKTLGRWWGKEVGVWLDRVERTSVGGRVNYL